MIMSDSILSVAGIELGKVIRIEFTPYLFVRGSSHRFGL